MIRRNTIFIHNRLMDYRAPLFTLLHETLREEIEFWFYHDTVRDFPATYFPFLEVSFRLPSRELSRQFSTRCIWALLKDGAARVVVLNGANANYELPMLYLAAKLRGLKLIFWTETWDWGRMSHEVYLFFKLNCLIAQQSDLVLYPGQKVHELYSRLGIPKARQFFIPNASANAPDLDLRYTEEAIKPTPGKLHVVYLGRLVARKGLHHLIEAMSLLPRSQYELIVGGSGDPLYEARCRQAASGNDCVRFCGPVGKDLVNSFLSVADVYVYPSVNHGGMGEPWGLTLNEAVALGKPCVATSMVGAAPDLIREGRNGFIVEPEDPHALATAIRRAAELPKAAVSDASRERTAVHSYSNMAKGFVEAIRSIL